MPQHIHQILIQKPFCAIRLSPLVHDNIARLKHLHPRASYRLWDHDALREVVATLGSEVAAAYDLLKPFAYKADLGRLCLLHKYGGLYSDLSFFFLERVRLKQGVGIMAFQDARSSSQHWTSISNGVLWATPGRQEIQIAIDMIVANVSRRYYGHTPLHPTGPALLGKAFAKALTGLVEDHGWSEQWVGEARILSAGARPENFAYFTPEQQLLAISRKSGGAGMVDLGIVGGNNYNTFWNAGTVYGENLLGRLIGSVRRS